MTFRRKLSLLAIALFLASQSQGAVVCETLFRPIPLRTIGRETLEFNKGLEEIFFAPQIENVKAVAKVMRQSHDFMINTSADGLIDRVFKNAPVNLRAKLKDGVTDIDHVGFILPKQINEETLAEAARLSGFFKINRSFPSSIVAKELGQKIGLALVPTQIFTLTPTGVDANATHGLEVFIPQASDDATRSWIQNNTGTHIALRVRRRELIAELTNELLASGFSMPGFMNNRPMENHAQGSTTSYFDLSDRGRSLRIELVHIEGLRPHPIEKKLGQELSDWVEKNHRTPDLLSKDKEERSQARIWAISKQLPLIEINVSPNAAKILATKDPEPQSARPYDTVSLVERFQGENEGKTLWSARLGRDVHFKTKYLDSKERKSYVLYTRAGRLVDLQGHNFDSSSGDLRGLSDSTGRAMIAMAQDGTLYAANEQEVGRFHHSSFLAGGPLAFAGEAVIKNGVILSLKNLSGHYLPGVELFAQVLDRLASGGIDVSQIELEGVE